MCAERVDRPSSTGRETRAGVIRLGARRECDVTRGGRWVRRRGLGKVSGILGRVVARALRVRLADGPAAPLSWLAASPAEAQTAPPKTGEPLLLKAIDHDKAKRGGTLRLAAHGPPSMFDIYA